VHTTRWTTAAVVVVGLFVMMASLALAFVVFFILAFSNIGFEGGAPPALRTGTNLLMGAGWAYLFAAGAVGKGWWSRTPVPFLVAGILLVVAEILTVQAQFHLQQLSSFRETLEPWILPLGIAGALLALAAAWLLQRPSAARAIATMVALAAASAAIVLFTMRSYAIREASERVCPHVLGAIEGKIKRNVIIPDSYLRGVRIQQSALNHAHWFVVADLQTNAKDFQGYTGPVVWLIDAPGASSQRMVEADRDRNQRIYAVNALAYSASKFPKKTMSAATLTRLDDCTKEVQREVSGMLGAPTAHRARRSTSCEEGGVRASLQTRPNTTATVMRHPMPRRGRALRGFAARCPLCASGDGGYAPSPTDRSAPAHHARRLRCVLPRAYR
jgi:hypothetical protein